MNRSQDGHVSRHLSCPVSSSTYRQGTHERAWDGPAFLILLLKHAPRASHSSYPLYLSLAISQVAQVTEGEDEKNGDIFHSDHAQDSLFRPQKSGTKRQKGRRISFTRQISDRNSTYSCTVYSPSSCKSVNIHWIRRLGVICGWGCRSGERKGGGLRRGTQTD